MEEDALDPKKELNRGYMYNDQTQNLQGSLNPKQIPGS